MESTRPRLVRHVHLGLLGDTGGWIWDSSHQQLVKAGPDLKTRVWRSDGPIDSEPLELMRGTAGVLFVPDFHAEGRWIAVPSNAGLAMWSLGRSYPHILRHHTQVVYGLAFSPDGDWIASSSMDFTLRLWPLDGTPLPPGRVLLGPDDRKQKLDLAVSPDGQKLLVGTGGPGAPQLVNLGSGSARVLPGFDSQVWSVAFSPSGRLAAAVGGEWEPRERLIRVWDVASGDELAVLGPEEDLRPLGLEFLDEHHVLSGGDSGLRRWDLRTGRSVMVRGGHIHFFAIDNNRRRVILTEGKGENAGQPNKALVLDLDSEATTPLATHGDRIRSVALDASGDVVVTGDLDGIIRVGPVTGDEPHLLIGHERSVEVLAVDPLGRWIASGSEDTTVRLWPMPDLSKPPLHTLPREELIAKLKTLTNLRVVRDPESATGWKLTHDP
ncbi:MAG: WD40 repeat domain-containing protein, partial [Acidobacteriota bacterium]